MRNFEEWYADALKGITMAVLEKRISKAERNALRIELAEANRTRKLEQLNTVIERLRSLGLVELCPTVKEIEKWFIVGDIRL